MLSSSSPPERKTSLFRAWLPAIWYWLGFLLFNFLLSLPAYLFDAQDADFLPRIDSLQALFIGRANQDIFRLNLEISLLILAFPLLRTLWQPAARRWWARFFYLIYLMALFYAIYESAITALYHTNPNFFNDYGFITGGIGFLIDGLRLSGWELAIIGLGIVVLLFLLYQIILFWFTKLPAAQMGQSSRYAAFALILLLLGFNFLHRPALASPESETRSLIAETTANARASIAARQEIASYQGVHPERTYDYAQTTRLFRRPDIYLIFIESYGSVLYKRPHFTDHYQSLMENTQAQLQDAGWGMVTGLSASPTWGGGSWMAYTSAEFGLHIASQPQFLAVKERYSQQIYPSLGRYFQSQGYRYIRLAPIQRTLGQKEEQANDALYGPDQWITFADLDYRGPLYGWGPSPPDQFSLNKARELLEAQADAPHFLFYLTQNSHYPFAPQPPIQAHWQALNNRKWHSPPPIGEPVAHRDNIMHYREAIRYQWETLRDFILTAPADRQSIFILIGDHQPPRVSRKDDGYETPIHIIARDAEFVQRFEQYGFEPGMTVGNLAPDMKHEALYSMLIRELVDVFGVSSAPIPYLPDGIQIDSSTPTHTTETAP